MSAVRVPPYAITWFGGEQGRLAKFVVDLPARLTERYDATGRLRMRPGETPTILTVTVTDRATGASVKVRGECVTLSVSQVATDGYVKGLWSDGRKIMGLARLQAGGPPSGTGTTVDDLIAAANRLREPDGTWPTQETVADHLGRDPRTIRRVASGAPGPGRPWKRILALAEDREGSRQGRLP